MSRIRTVKPEWLEDELLAAASDAARTLSVGLILLADDYGNGRASIATLAASVWRFELERDDGARAAETLAKASGAFRELVEIRFIGCWTESGQRYYAIRNWARHQRVDKPGKPLVPRPPEDLFKETKPEPETNSRSVPEPVASDSRESRERLAPDLDLDLDPDREGKGTRAPEAAPVPPPQPPATSENEHQATEPKLTICPLDLVEKAEAAGIVRDFVERYRVDADQIRDGIREFTSHWTIGGGTGRREANWFRKLRTDLKFKCENGKLKALGDIQHREKAQVTAPYHAPAKRRREGPVASPQEAKAAIAGALEALAK